MCNADTSITTQGFGAITSAIGAYSSASSQKISLKSRANTADTNSRIADLNADQATFIGKRQKQQSQLETAGFKDRQTTSFAGHGIDLGSETVKRVLTSTDVLGEMDVNTISANAARAAWGYKTEGVNFRNEALQTRATASAVDPLGSAGTSLITSAGSISKDFYKFGKSGSFKKGGLYDKIYRRSQRS